MISTLIKITLLGFLATISAKTGITIFYEIFPPEHPRNTTHGQAMPAALIGILFALPFLFFLFKSVNWKKNKKSKFLKKVFKEKNKNLD